MLSCAGAVGLFRLAPPAVERKSHYALVMAHRKAGWHRVVHPLDVLASRPLVSLIAATRSNRSESDRRGDH